MKRPLQLKENGSVLITTMMAVTILTLICATSLYVTSQNLTAGMQVASWQQALSAAESGVDRGIRALNSNDWTNWRTAAYPSPAASYLLPTSEANMSPAPTPTATGPDSSHYNYFPSNLSTITMQGEGALTLSHWVTIDQAGMPATEDTSGKQWYRIRSTGMAGITGPSRVSMNRLDNDLRNTISLVYNRKGGSTLGPTRTIECIMSPVTTSIWVRGITAVNWFSLSGGMVIDSFNSTDPWKSTGGLYDVGKRQSHGDVATTNSTSSDFRNTSVYGNVAYSGPAIKNTTPGVTGQIATPGPATPAAVSAPSWSNGTYVSYGGGSPPFTTTAAANKAFIKVNGDFTVPGGTTLALVAGKDSSNNPITNITIWVTGKLTTSGSGFISQDPAVKITWYVGKDITVSGSSYQNSSGQAANLTINAYGPSNSKLTISGSAAFVGAINAPNYSATISGGGDFSGALIANNVTMSGGSNFHYDEALNGGNSAVIGNYAFASWFEDNSDPQRKDSGRNTIIY